ncbi:Arc family DNA-binding protein [Stutzerimonas kunmingensis]|jgi:hypothetical protein|uniref:Arc family DNA-binding protein n=1 Tax=Stutzerimonas kunmingensis TaxID=1211807 RepID=UPI0028AD90C2|nr:Arc family DNA-binding protein [Stutzerimonas kunmingensis]
MKEVQRVNPFPLRLGQPVRERAKDEASKYRRSLNTELSLLIEEGFKWREMQSRQAVA